MTRGILKSACLNAAATAAYVIGIGSLLFYAPQFFGRLKTPLIPIAMLLLLVFSAALTGSLMLGKPALWYLDGKKKEALSLLVATLLIFLGITLLAFLTLYFAHTG
jgi:hypothetical protein